MQQVAESRAPMVRLADRYAVPFTAVACLIAGLAWWLPQDPSACKSPVEWWGLGGRCGSLT
ncbi:cation transport ATPase [Micrococcus aloeverae]|uniref:Cation transport ATPase n=1 Tax=Micrococcus aloeverae TaxID=1391911 RepID=A0ABR6E293_9MICC|nr:cation transport ATPase [Micrococcus aloeverae]